MTQEEKAKAYDKALNTAREILNHTSENYLCTHLTKKDIKDMYIRFFPELKESEDEKIRKALICGMNALKEQNRKTFATIPINDCITWLEKQGEQKPIIDGILTATNYDKMFQNCNVPKFNVGDWVVYYRNDSSREVLQVYDIRDGRYYFTDNVHFSWSVKECDEKSHLWTIQDAKDGDVLATDDRPFIYNGNINPLSVGGYCGITYDGHFKNYEKPIGYSTDGWTMYDNDIHPATKEQSDLLFSKMKEVGYEWDSEKKELKKIEQKPTWDEDDEKMLVDAYVMLDWYKGNNWWTARRIKDWLNSLKERIGG